MESQKTTPKAPWRRAKGISFQLKKVLRQRGRTRPLKVPRKDSGRRTTCRCVGLDRQDVDNDVVLGRCIKLTPEVEDIGVAFDSIDILVIRNLLVQEIQPKLKFHVVAEVANIGVQCCPEEMLEPMSVLRAFQHRRLLRLREEPLWEDLDKHHSVETHFSSFREPEQVCLWSRHLTDAQLKILAQRFLGRELAGIVVRPRPLRLWRRVAERHVEEARLLAAAAPVFRAALLRAAHELLVTGLDAPPYLGHGLLEMAVLAPSQWSGPALTALDFTARLVSAGALPRAFLAVVIAHASGGLAGIRADACEAVVDLLSWTVLNQLTKLPVSAALPGLVQPAAPAPTALPEVGPQQALAAAPCSVSTPAAGRSESIASARSSVRSCMLRNRSIDASACSQMSRRSSGTSLRPQDETGAGAFCRISFAGRGNGAALNHTIPLEIPKSDLPDYWRFVAGGEHSPQQIEKFARQADDQIN